MEESSSRDIRESEEGLGSYYHKPSQYERAELYDRRDCAKRHRRDPAIPIRDAVQGAKGGTSAFDATR
jgi:hypothetical protein